jgi:hypothetical protein
VSGSYRDSTTGKAKKTDLAGNFALGGLTDAQAHASMRRFMEQVAPEAGN